jgi:hypothetical protein
LWEGRGSCEKKFEEERKMGGNDKEKITFKQSLSFGTCEDDLKTWNDARRRRRRRRRGTFRKII